MPTWNLGGPPESDKVIEIKLLQLMLLDIPRVLKSSCTSFKGPDMEKEEFDPIMTCTELSRNNDFAARGSTKYPQELTPVRVIVSAPASASDRTAEAKGNTTPPAEANEGESDSEGLAFKDVATTIVSL
jgi:hypothetical protein